MCAVCCALRCILFASVTSGATALGTKEALLSETLPFYHTSDGIIEAAQALASEGSCRGLTVALETEDVAALPVARLPALGATNGDSLKSVIVFGEHARELISPEVGLHFLKHLCSKDGSDLRANKSFVMVLNANPHGRRKVEGGAYCTRTNENDVDLNRNYGFHWKAEKADLVEKGVGAEAGKEMEPFSSGTGPFSEPETRIVARILKEAQPTLFLDVHSGTKALFMPYDWTLDPIPNQEDRQRMLDVLREVGEQDCPECLVGDCGETLGYLAPGSSADYSYSQGIPFSFIWEIYEGAEDAKSDAADRESYQARQAAAAAASSADPFASISARASATSLLATRSRRLRRTRDSPPAWAAQDDVMMVSVQNEATEHCLEEFNPTTEAEYNSTLERWTRAFRTALAGIERRRSKNVGI